MAKYIRALNEKNRGPVCCEVGIRIPTEDKPESPFHIRNRIKNNEPSQDRPKRKVISFAEVEAALKGKKATARRRRKIVRKLRNAS